jgi:regulator of protease activity HflC (stomatin/prohibitin superfamily)
MTTVASRSLPVSTSHATNRERVVSALSGWMMLPIVLLMYVAGPALVVRALVRLSADDNAQPHPGLMILGGVLLLFFSVVMTLGFFTLQPNEARVLVLFGGYKGSVRQGGFHWANPFYANRPRNEPTRMQSAMEAAARERHPEKKSAPSSHKVSRFRVSLRVRNLISERLKVNDKRGNPVEIAAVIVWRVDDTAQAMFDVDDYEDFVRIQTESAIRHVASTYSYDQGEEHETTLLSGSEEVSEALRAEVQTRLAKAGVAVEEARLTHLAYAPEIAQAMLRRQQAEAVIAARQKIVHGAVSMVDMALRELAEKGVVTLDDERKAAMVSNLMVVLCGESEVHPVVNTGTLYT